MEVEVLRKAVMGRPWGYMQEEVRKEEEGGEGEERRRGGTFI